MEDKTSNAAGHDLSGRYERLYTMLLDAIPSSVLLIDQNMCIVSANRNFLEKGRRTLANTIGYRLEEVFPTRWILPSASARSLKIISRPRGSG